MNINKLKEENKKLRKENESLRQLVNSEQNNIKRFKSDSFTIRKDHENIFAWFALSKPHECYIIPDEDRNFVCIDIPTDCFVDLWKYLDSQFEAGDGNCNVPTFTLDLDELKVDYDIVLLNSNCFCDGVYKIRKVNNDEYEIIPQTLIVDLENHDIEVEDE